MKDNIDVAGLPTTAACPDFAYTPAAIGVRRRAARARRRDRGRQDQSRPVRDRPRRRALALRGPRNALRADLIPGGSSSGSAVAVGGGPGAFALGTDTAGSGRVPAAFNGIVGLKPTLGALSAPASSPPAGRSTRSRSSRSTSPTPSRSLRRPAAYDDGDAYAARFPRRRCRRCRRGIRLGVPAPEQRRVFRRRRGGGGFRRATRELAGARRPRSSSSTSSPSPKSRGCSTRAPGSPSATPRRSR